MKKHIFNLIFALSLGLALSGFAAAQDEADLQLPNLPCPEIAAPEGHKLKRIVYAIGVQIYRWNGSAWAFVAPEANLYADPHFQAKIGTHYAGPTWEANNGGKVVASRVDGCSPDPESIAWLLLKSVDNEGPGVFGKTSYIQRLSTVSGLAPQRAGQFVGEEVRMPYTTEYLFYTEKRTRN
ncbi:MAG: DUF3455 domain-containing protein [Pyrinomonadaceae bacterium]